MLVTAASRGDSKAGDARRGQGGALRGEVSALAERRSRGKCALHTVTLPLVVTGVDSCVECIRVRAPCTLCVVSVRRRINNVLSRVSGYELRRVRREPAGGGEPTVNIPADIDEEAAAIIRAVRPYTMTNVEKLYAVITAARYVTRHGVPGAVVECGVWRGGSMHAMARAFDAVGEHERELYLFDTYEGMTEPGPKDRRGDGRQAAELMASYGKTSRIWAYASLEDVQAGFRQVPYPQDKVHFVKGPVEQTIPAEAPERIAVLRLDTDWYDSTAHELAHLYDRLVPGGVLLLDDYGWWQGSREAVDEFVARTGARLFLARTGTGRVAIKPAD